MFEDERLIHSITPDVMTVLKRERIFESLDDLLSPSSDSSISARCDGTHKLLRQILSERHYDGQAVEDALEVLRSLGGCCDCEVLYNVATESRLKATYWKGHASIPEHHSFASGDRD